MALFEPVVPEVLREDLADQLFGREAARAVAEGTEGVAALGAVEFWFACSRKSIEEEMGAKVDERALFIATQSGHATLRVLSGLLFAGTVLALVGYGFTKDALWMAVALTLCGVVVAMFLVLLVANCYYEKKY